MKDGQAKGEAFAPMPIVNKRLRRFWPVCNPSVSCRYHVGAGALRGADEQGVRCILVQNVREFCTNL